jgi:hypothetical protein
MRINDSENTFIFKPKDNVESIQQERATSYYTIFGQHDFIDSSNRPRVKTDSSDVFAKLIANQSGRKFFIKIGTYGKVFNPIGMYSEGQNNKFLSKIGRQEWQFKEVNEKTFDLYLNFLSTKNIAWLSNAERELS